MAKEEEKRKKLFNCKDLLMAKMEGWMGQIVELFSREDLLVRVSHLQFFLISLLFQAGIYARHTKEQETYRFHMF